MEMPPLFFGHLHFRNIFIRLRIQKQHNVSVALRPFLHMRLDTAQNLRAGNFRGRIDRRKIILEPGVNNVSFVFRDFHQDSKCIQIFTLKDARIRCQQGSPAAVITTVERRLSHHRGVHVIISPHDPCGKSGDRGVSVTSDSKNSFSAVEFDVVRYGTHSCDRVGNQLVQVDFKHPGAVFNDLPVHAGGKMLLLPFFLNGFGG